MFDYFSHVWIVFRCAVGSAAFQNIFFNVVGGLLTVPFAALFAKLWQYLRRRQFKKVFGPGQKSFVLAYGSLSVADRLTSSNRFVLEKKSVPGFNYSAERVLNECEARAAAYVAAGLSRDGGLDAALRADEEIRDRVDIDFISFGAMNNLKTIDLLNNARNRYAVFDQKSLLFVSKDSGWALHERSSGYQFGIIIRLHPEQFDQRTWLCCAGDGEWGTSGAAWYLSHKWRELARKLKSDQQFLAVIRVREGQDESATLLSFAI